MGSNLQSKIKKGLLWNVIRIIVQVAAGLITSLFTAKILISPENYGQYNYILMIANIFYAISILGYDIPMLRIIGEEPKESEANNKAFYIIKFCTKNLIIISPLFFIVVALCSKFTIIPNYVTKYLFTTILACITLWGLNLFNNILMGLKRFKEANIVSIASMVLFAAFEVLIFLFNKKITPINLNNFKNLFSVIAVLIGIITVRKIIKSINFKYKYDIKPYRNQAREVFLIHLNDLVVWDKSEIFFLGKFGLNYDLGLYSFGYQIVTNTASMVVGVFSNLCIPSFAEIKNGSQNDINRIYYDTVRIISGITAVAYITGLFLLEIIIRHWLKAYTPVVNMLYILFIGKVMSSIGSIGSALIHVNNKSKYMVYSSYATGIVNILLDIFLIKKYGFMGAAIANTTAQIFGMILGIYIMVKIIGYDFPYFQFMISVAVYLFYIFVSFKTGSIFAQVAVIVISVFVFICYNKKYVKIILLKLREKFRLYK